VAPYDPEDRLTHPLDYRIAQRGGVALYWQLSVLDETVSWLRDRGYRVVHMDASTCATELDVHRLIADALGFPSYYGENLNALADCLYDVTEAEYGWSLDETGLALVFTRWDVVVAANAQFASGVLDVIATAIAQAALLGNRMLCLVQTNNNRRQPEQPLGGSALDWNDAEWSDANRGL
jgi:hypothetical protein